jgi:SNF2 family DNA or RNA helicase
MEDNQPIIEDTKNENAKVESPQIEAKSELNNNQKLCNQTKAFIEKLSFNHSLIEKKIEEQQNGLQRFGKRVIVDRQKLVNPRKKRKKTNKNSDVEKLVTFNPLVGGKGPSDRSKTMKATKIENYKPIMTPLPYEEEFLKDIPLKFFDHQIDAVRWMYWIETKRPESRTHVGGILGDVMGLGKTIDGIGLVYYDLFRFKRGYDNVLRPTLIVAPLTLLQHWQSEAYSRIKLAPEDVLIYHTTKRFRLLNNAIEKGKLPLIVVATYETVQNDFTKFQNGVPNTLFSIKWQVLFQFTFNNLGNVWILMKHIPQEIQKQTLLKL